MAGEGMQDDQERAAGGPQEGRRNLLLITVDSLRADHLGCLASQPQLSPRLDDLAAEGVLFGQALANGPRSPASFPALMACRYLSEGAEDGIPQGALTLAQVLRQAGYATAGFSGGNPYISTHTGYHQGFDTFRDYVGQGRPARLPRAGGLGARLKRRLRQRLEESGRYDAALLLFASTLRGKKDVTGTARGEQDFPFEGGEVLNRQALDWLANAAHRPFFLWLHYMDVHYPYLPRVARYPLADLGRFALAASGLLLGRRSYARRVMLDLYRRRIQELDGRIGELLDELRRRGLYNDTLLVVTADHGEEFLEHGGWGHAAKLYDELLRVPLILRGAGLPSGREVRRQASLMDLAATILELLGLDRAQARSGLSLLPLVQGLEDGQPERPVMSEALHLGGRQPPLWGQGDGDRPRYWIRSCRTGEWKYIRDQEGGREELYHLGLDPGEHKNVVYAEPQVAAELDALLSACFAKAAPAGPQAASLDAGEEQEILARLRALGYY